MLTTHLFSCFQGYSPVNNQIVYIYDLGRNYQTNNFILRYMAPISAIGYAVASAIQAEDSSLAKLIYYSNPYYLTNPLSVNYVNLHDVGVYGENFASFMSFVLLWMAAQTTVLLMYTFSLNPKIQFGLDMAMLTRLKGMTHLNKKDFANKYHHFS